MQHADAPRRAQREPGRRRRGRHEFKQYFDKNVSASGRHGFTFNGFDWATKGNELQANLARAKFLLNYAEKGAAAKWVDLLKRAFPKDAAIQALTPQTLLEQLGGAGKFVIKITAQGVKVGAGAGP